LVNALPGFEFVYGDGPYEPNLWMADPPGGKDEPTTDPDWAIESVNHLNEIVETEGPFYGLLGYSQGAAYTAVYLSDIPDNTFQVVMSFCGYLTTTHLGLLAGVSERKPFADIQALVWMGRFDFIISNELSEQQAEVFANPLIIKSNVGGHAVPGNDDPTFDEVVAFIENGVSPTSSPRPTLPPVPTTPTTVSPTVAPVVAPPTTLSCPDEKEVPLTIRVLSDNNGDKIAVRTQERGFFNGNWQTLDDVSQVGFESNTLTTLETCINVFLCYRFTIADFDGDGLCCEDGSGGYAISVEDEIVFGSRFSNGNREDYSLETCD